jgi:hypothetical protein
MIKHYLKIAFRNLWKYRNQTLVSIAGLAVGFVCFAISALWIRHEMTYDSFHKNADRMYLVNQSGFFTEIIDGTPYPLAGYLKSTFPEIANAVAVVRETIDFKHEGINRKTSILRVDS